MKKTSLILLLLTLSCSTPYQKSASLEWQEKSKKLAHEYAKDIGQLSPEYVADIGFDEFEPFTTPYSRMLDQELYVLSYKWKNRLERMLEQENEEEFKTDIRILLEKVSLDMEQVEMARSEGVVSFLPVSEHVYLSLKDLIYEGASQTKLENALKRFKYYVKGYEGELPLVSGVIAYTVNQLNQLEGKQKKGFWPTREEVETYLKESASYFEAIEGLLSRWRPEEWKSDLNELKIQEAEYREFLIKKILPFSRPDNKTSYGIYAFTLKDMGVKESPEKLIEVAKSDYRELYEKFSELGRAIAAEHNLSSRDPLSVVKFLRSRKIETKEELLKLYVKTNDEMFDLVKEKDLLTLKEKPHLLIRFATEAEARSLPAPHFINAPFFGNDQHRPGQFVITPPEGGRDDFSFPEAVVTLSAHEAIPGHGLQYHVMRERGTTLMRSWLAFNSVNVEGWGLYAEDIVYPYLSKEAQFITLQRRLWRIARMFLDPELNLGKIKPQRVLDVFMNELGFSEPFARSELKRYSYLMPGQAVSYYYGYKKLMSMKSHKTNLKCFNDAVLNFGILPLDEISARLKLSNCEGAP